LGIWNLDQWFLANQTIDFNPKLQILKIQRNSQRIYPEPLVRSCFFQETSQSFEFFSNAQNLKLLQSEVLIKAQHTGCLNLKTFKILDWEVITKSKNHPTVVYRARKDVVFHGSLLKQNLHLASLFDPAHRTATPMVSPFYGRTRVSARTHHAPWNMDDKWSGNNFLSVSSSVGNHGGYLSCTSSGLLWAR
jgi:hypothetical protein